MPDTFGHSEPLLAADLDLLPKVSRRHVTVLPRFIMVVCQFYLKGNCRFGLACRNEHPVPNPGPNRWSARTPNANSTQTVPNTLFSIESMTRDFTTNVDKPLWPMSSYGPAKYEPTLITNLDESPEELRARAMVALKTGSISDYLKYESNKILAADQTYSNARTQVDQAYNGAVSNSSSGGIASALASTNKFGSSFGAGADVGMTSSWSSASAFGSQPTAFGSKSSAFDSQPSAFGSQTSTLGGQPSAFGSQPSGFGQTSGSNISATTSAFGKPSFGTPFGQSFTGSAPAFSADQSSTSFGGGSKFNTGSRTGGFSAFSATRPSEFGSSTPTFGQPSFGMPSTTTTPATTTTSAFGVSATSAPTSAFGTPAQGVSGSAFAPVAPPAFGDARSTQMQGPFGTTANSTFGASASQMPASTFALPQTQTQGTAAFGASQPQQPPVSAFGTLTTQPPSAFGAITSTAQGSAFSTIPQSNFAFNTSAMRPRGGTPFDAYDKLLPPDEEYIKMIPPEAMRAFEADEFAFGSIPEWIPPKKMR